MVSPFSRRKGQALIYVSHYPASLPTPRLDWHASSQYAAIDGSAGQALHAWQSGAPLHADRMLHQGAQQTKELVVSELVSPLWH